MITLLEKYEKELIKKLETINPLIITGPTGSGKSTFTPILLNRLYPNKKIVLIQPRRIAVISLYNFLKEKIPIKYKIRFEKKLNESNITIMTDGMFLNEYLYKEYYDIIIIDEVHEKNLRTEMILAILKNNIIKSKIILMSATLEIKKLELFFKADVFKFKGNQFPCKVVYETEPVSDYITYSYLKVKNIIETYFSNLQLINQDNDDDDNNNNKDILIFLPGEEDINDLFRLLKRIPYIKAIKLFSTVNKSEELKVFLPSKEIKVILSTNICETSITIPGIKYVIDTGLCKIKIFNGIEYFGITEITKESADQRKGRCNRMESGVCYRLYTEESYNKMKRGTPEIQKSNLDFFILYFLALKNNLNIKEMEFLDLPNNENLKISISFLKKINALKTNKLEISLFGLKLMKFPLEISLSNFLINSNKLNCGIEAAKCISLISQSNFNFMEQIRESSLIDILYLVNLFNDYLISIDKLEFCDSKRIKLVGMQRAELIYNQISKSAKGNDLNKLELAFSNSFNHNKSIIQTNGGYKLRDKIIYISPNSYFFSKRCKQIVFVDVICTTKNYCRIVGKYLS